MAVRRLVSVWWARIGAEALLLAKRIAKPAERADADESDESEADVSLSDYSSAADAGWFSKSVDNAAVDVDRHTKAELKRIGIRLSSADPGVAKLLPRFRKDNVGLVKTMLRSEQSKLEALLRDGAGRRIESLSADIEERLGITTRHAELIARDQTLKLNANIAHTRMRNAGITSAVWTTSGDERVRDSHAEMDGEQFDLDDPPTVDDEQVLPGEPINCRCVSFPILPELSDDTEEDDSDE